MQALPLLLSWVLDFVPVWLSPTLLFVGGVTLVYGLLQLHETYHGCHPLRRLVMGTGFALVYLPFHRRFSFVSVLLLALTAKYLEGVAAVRFYQKLLYAAKNRGTKGNGLHSFVRTRVTFKLLGVLVTVVAVWAAIYYLLAHDATTVGYDLAVGWTVATAGGSIVGLTYKLQGTVGKVPRSLVVGFAVTITGAELHNLGTLRADLLLFGLSGIAYAGGYLVAVGLWYRYGSDLQALSNAISVA